MRQRWMFLIALAGLLLSAAPAAATVRDIDPSAPPPVTLGEAEAQKLAALQRVTVPLIYSLVSPDDSTVVTLTTGIFGGPGRLAFVNVNDGSSVPIQDTVFAYPPLTEIRWRDAATAVYPSLAEDATPVLVTLDRASGAVMTDTLALPAFPLSFAPNASRMLVVSVSQTESLAARPPTRSPFDRTLRLAPAKPVDPTATAFTFHDPSGIIGDRRTLQLSSVVVTLAAYDLASGALTPLVSLPPNTGLAAAAWTPDGNKLAVTRYSLLDAETRRVPGREGDRLSELIVQDTLGRLAPADNPFLQRNAVDVFDLGRGDFRPAALRAADGNGDLFTNMQWSSDGQTLMAQMMRPARLAGRRYPIYTFQFAESSYLRFYDASLQLLNTFDRPETAAPLGTAAQWASPDELIIRTVYGLSQQLYYYNRVSGEFRKASFEDGAYYSFVTTHQSRQIIFNHSSLQRPYELFRIGFDGQGFAGLSFNNEQVRALNQVRVDTVTFRMRGGANRTGLLVQPADAAFPPRNVPIVVWQEGGPGGWMINQWGSNVENPYNLLPNFGIAVLVLPLAGREGYGPGLINDLANGRNFGQIDIGEQAQAVEQLIRRGYTTRQQVGIVGCSYGGYFVSQSITQYPSVYAAANSQCSALDLFFDWQSGYTWLWAYLEGRTPMDDPAEYVKDSPINNASHVKTPLLLFHGTVDFLPIAIADNFHDQVAANGTPISYLRFANEGHGLVTLTSQFIAGQAQLEWFRQYLRPAGSR